MDLQISKRQVKYSSGCWDISYVCGFIQISLGCLIQNKCWLCGSQFQGITYTILIQPCSLTIGHHFSNSSCLLNPPVHYYKNIEIYSLLHVKFTLCIDICSLVFMFRIIHILIKSIYNMYRASLPFVLVTVLLCLLLDASDPYKKLCINQELY